MSYGISVIVAYTVQLVCEAEQDVFFPCIGIVIYYIADKTGQDRTRKDKTRQGNTQRGQTRQGHERQD